MTVVPRLPQALLSRRSLAAGDECRRNSSRPSSSSPGLALLLRRKLPVGVTSETRFYLQMRIKPQQFQTELYLRKAALFSESSELKNTHRAKVTDREVSSRIACRGHS